MDRPSISNLLHNHALAKGEQLVVNGALLEAECDCAIAVAQGAYVFTGRRLSSARVREPHAELYFSLIQLADTPERFAPERVRLFALLSQIVIEDSAEHIQDEAHRCSMAMLAGDLEAATLCAKQLAAAALDDPG